MIPEVLISLSLAIKTKSSVRIATAEAFVTLIVSPEISAIGPILVISPPRSMYRMSPTAAEILIPIPKLNIDGFAAVGVG